MTRPITIKSDVGPIHFDVPNVPAASFSLVGLGAPGPAGPSGTVNSYTHTQASASATWTINHNLGRRPLIQLFTTGSGEFDGQITHTSDNQAVVNLAAAVAGTARCI